MTSNLFLNHIWVLITWIQNMFWLMIDVHYSLFQCFEIDVTNTVELLPVCKNKPKYFEIILVVKTAYFFKHKKQIS